MLGPKRAEIFCVIRNHLVPQNIACQRPYTNVVCARLLLRRKAGYGSRVRELNQSAAKEERYEIGAGAKTRNEDDWL